jgi:hypothetical protein
VKEKKEERSRRERATKLEQMAKKAIEEAGGIDLLTLTLNCLLKTSCNWQKSNQLILANCLLCN